MIYIRPDGYAFQLLQLLSVAGEFPLQSLPILGNSRTLRDLVRRLERKQEIRIGWNGHTYHAQLLSVSGKRGQARTVRLHKGGLPLLGELHPAAMDYYLSSFRNHAFSGKREDVERNHRVAEALGMMLASGIEMRPYALPLLSASGLQLTVPEAPSFYPAKVVKRQGGDAMNKTGFTRMAGLLLRPGLAHVVYNTRSAAMKWHGSGEIKARQQCEEVARRNARIHDLKSAILMGHTCEAAMATLEAAQKQRSGSFEMIYDAIHFVPMNGEGKQMLRLLCITELQEKLRDALFPAHMRLAGYADCDCDAMGDGKYILSHLDGDLARLLRFRLAAWEDSSHAYEVICYPWQAGYVKRLFAETCSIRCLSLDTVQKAFSVGWQCGP